MKVILIEEERFAEVAALMKAEALNLSQKHTVLSLCEMYKVPPEAAAQFIQEVSRCTHFHFVRWAQSHGASCVPK